MVGRMPSPRVESAAGVTSCFGNVPLMFLNVSIVDRPAATSDDLRALLNTAAQRSASCEYPSGIILREDWLPSEWEDLIGEAGFAVMLFVFFAHIAALVWDAFK